MGMQTPALLTETAAAAYLGIGRTKLRELVSDGVVPVLRIGKSVRYARQDLDAFITALRREATHA